MKHEMYMQRCIELALNGLQDVAPNPMVGAVIVHNTKIIGEGFHQQYGEAHAEVNAIASVENKKLLSQSILYVSLEPCNHFGKTPPCTELIKKYKIPTVVIGSTDTNINVAGNGIKNLKAAGITVIKGVLEKECLEVNKRFFHFIQAKQPYIILKWAQSKDGKIGDKTKGNVAISNEYSQQLVHKWRSEEAAILVGTTTAALDNPRLDVRYFCGTNPLRLVIDWKNKLSPTLSLFDTKIPTLVFTRKKLKGKSNLEYVEIPKSKNELVEVLNQLAKKNIQSLLIEGGATLLQSFIDANLWNEARIFTASKNLGEGVNAPQISGKISGTAKIKSDTLVILKNVKK